MAGAERADAVVRIDGIAAGGAGVGRLESGQAVFVHRTAPDETVRVRVTERKKRWARADLVELVEASPARRDAPCPHYDRCGGCTLEHLRYDAQLRAKSEIVREAFRRIGGIEIDAPDVVPSPREFRYRNRVSFTLKRLRDGRVVAGFHTLGRPDRVLDISADCLLPEEPVAEAWRALRESWGDGAARLPAGPELRLTLRAGHDGAVGLLIEGGDAGTGEAAALLRVVPGLVAVWHRTDRAEMVRTLAGADTMSEQWDDFALDLAPTAFLQVNRATARLLEDHVLERAGDVAGRTVVDAYCGVGFHAQRLAAAGASVVGIELDAAAVEQGRALAAQRGVPAVFIAGDVAAELRAVLPADLVILNPPRAGIDVAVTDALVAQPPRRLIYVSCDPATLARDAQRLAPALRLEAIRCFDLFPQTSHVETVAEFIVSEHGA
ncbi:MAG TPA: TRAM domain-containing protein [Longimicrobiales bacterium]